MSHPDGDPPRPRRVFDFDTLVDYAGLLLAVPFIVFITWLILNPTHLSLWLTGHRVDAVLAAALLDALILSLVVSVILLRQRPPTSLIWKVLMLGIFVSLCAGLLADRGAVGILVATQIVAAQPGACGPQIMQCTATTS